jgi:hypothetical protein
MRFQRVRKIVNRRPPRARLLCFGALAGLVAAAALAPVAGQQPVQPPSPPPAATASTSGASNLSAASAGRKKQIADDSARLFKLATDLKAEVDKTTKDTLSIAVIRKADAIEKLARSVREKTKPPMGAN